MLQCRIITLTDSGGCGMHDPSDTRIVPSTLTVFRHHRLAAIVDILARRRQDEPDCETPLPAERCACGRYRLIIADDIGATAREDERG
jgi:hypothetical protein